VHNIRSVLEKICRSYPEVEALARRETRIAQGLANAIQIPTLDHTWIFYSGICQARRLVGEAGSGPFTDLARVIFEGLREIGEHRPHKAPHEEAEAVDTIAQALALPWGVSPPERPLAFLDPYLPGAEPAPSWEDLTL
jgi:hypothetical protein